MVKEIERYGIPIVHIATITTISTSVGANRIMPAVAIPYPVGNPKLPTAEEKAMRYELIDKALRALETPISEQTIF
jgi:glycine reductase complex component B subunit gamma